MKRALITGGSGFVGREFVRYMRDDWDILNVDLENGDDCRDFFRMDPYKYDLVIHLAAIVGGRRTIESKPLSVAEDFAIDADFFNWVERAQPAHVVYFSISPANPICIQKREGSEQPLLEWMVDLDHVDTPDLTYGWAKLTGEFLARFSSVPVNIFRPFSGYGTDQALDYPFPSFIKRALDRSDPFEIWGTGNQVRDFIHISDIVRAVFAALDSGFTAPVNLCTGIPTSFNALQTQVCRIAEFQPKVRYRHGEPTGVYYRVGDPTLMNQFYTHKVDLEQGIRMALRGQV